MKIAIPTNNQSTISQHFGKSKGFMIYEVENNEIINKEYIDNSFTGHAMEKHNKNVHNHKHSHQHKHSHNKIINGIGYCAVVIAGGMGKRLYNDFSQSKIQVFITKTTDIDEAINLYLNNNLDNDKENCCNHH